MSIIVLEVSVPPYVSAEGVLTDLAQLSKTVGCTVVTSHDGIRRIAHPSWSASDLADAISLAKAEQRR